MPEPASLQALLDPLFPGLMGVHLIELAPERVVAEMKVRPDLCTAGGILHGGAYMAFADTLGAVGTLLNLKPGKRTTTTDSSTKFIAGARLDTDGHGRMHRPASRPHDDGLADLGQERQTASSAPSSRKPSWSSKALNERRTSAHARPARRPGLPVPGSRDRDLRRLAANDPRPTRYLAAPRQRPPLHGRRLPRDGNHLPLGRASRCASRTRSSTCSRSAC